MSRVSFIIPSYNSYETIRSALESIRKQRAVISIGEIIIVDSSDDGRTADLLKRQQDHKTKVILLNKRATPSKARNIGAMVARGQLLCFVDSDVVLDELWLDKILGSFQSGCLAGAGSVSTPPCQSGKSIAAAQLYLEFNESLPHGQNRKKRFVPACNMFVEKGLWERVGGFPEVRASEDVMLCLKINEITPIWFIPGAYSYHIFREQMRLYLSNQVIIGYSILNYRRQIHPAWFYRGVWPAMFLPGIMVIKMIRISRRVQKAGWSHSRKYLSSFHLFIAGFAFWSLGFFKACLPDSNGKV